MNHRDNTEKERAAWSHVGADEVIFQIFPIHTHTVNGDRVKLTGIIPHKNTPDIDGIILSDKGEEPARWSATGDSLDGDDSRQLHVDAAATLRQIAYFGDALCPG